MSNATGGEGNPHVQGGSLVLNIGGDIGALIAYLPESFAGTEVYISVADGSKPFTHTGVHPRGMGGTLRQTAVYPELATGDYQLWHPADASPLGEPVHVDGGVVAELNLIGRVADVTTAPTAHTHADGHSHTG